MFLASAGVIIAGLFAAEKVELAMKQATKAATDTAFAAVDGLDRFKDSSAALLRRGSVMPSSVAEVRARQEARYLGMPVFLANALTPQQRAKKLKLKEFQTKIKAAIESLEEEIDDLSDSFFRPFYRNKISVKIVKKAELNRIYHVNTWEDLQERVDAALLKTTVVQGRSSRTRDLLQEIKLAQTEFLEQAEGQQSALANPTL